MIQKTKILTLIVFGLLFINLSAQEESYSNDPVAKLPDDDRKFRFGLQFSPNISWLKTNTTGYESKGSKTGFSYGLSVEYYMSKNYLFSSGLFLSYAGGKLGYKGIHTRLSRTYSADAEVKYNLRYIELPMILKLRTNEIGYLTYFGQFGFKTGFNYKSNANYLYNYIDPISSFPQNGSESVANVSDDINWINMYLVIGAGVENSISGNTALSLGLTFNNGFVNQLDTKVNALDANGEAIIDATTGQPVFTDKDANANLNYIALNIGIYF